MLLLAHLDVVPIAGSPSAPRVGATDSPPFEHALRMLQFDPRLELTHLLQAGDIAASECAALGTRIAQMHADAALADPAVRALGVGRLDLSRAGPAPASPNLSLKTEAWAEEDGGGGRR